MDKVSGTLGVYTLLSNGDGTWQVRYDTPWKDATGTVVTYGPADLQHWAPAELNGDGRLDLLHLSFLDPGLRVEYLLSNGDGTWTSGAHDYFAATTTTTPMPLDALTVPTVQDFRLFDVNGDGLTDLVHVEHVGSAGVGTRIRTLLANGDGTFTPRQWSANVPNFVDARRWRPMEANGDGMGDLVHIGYTRNGLDSCLNIELLVSQGDGTWVWKTYGAACHVALNSDENRLLEDPSLIRLMDVNGDGRTDLVHVSDYWYGLNQRKTAVVLFENSLAGGGSWVKTVRKNLQLSFYTNDPWTWQSWQSPWTGGPGLAYAHAQHLYGMQWLAPSDRMTRLSNGLGASTNVSYGLLLGRRSYLPSGMIPTVTDAVEVSDGAYTPPAAERTTYDYAGARWSDRERRLLGYGVRIAKTGGLGTLATYRLSDECGAQLGSSEQRHASGDTFGALFRATHFSYLAPGTGPPYTCLLKEEERREYELGTTYRATRRNYSYDAYGNVSRLYEVGNLGDVLDDRWTDSGVVANEAGYLVGLPAVTTVSGVVATTGGYSVSVLSSTLNEYDGNSTYAAPPGALGELRRRKQWNDQNGTYVTTEFQYDRAGNVTRTTDPAGIWKSVTYDPTYALFPEKECNAHFCTSRSWDVVLGVPITNIDENNQLTQRSYDAYGRLERTDRPDGSFTRMQYLEFGLFTGGVPCSHQRVRTEESDGSPGDGVLWSEANFDGLGRTCRTVSEGGTMREFEFADASERPARESAAYAPGETPAWTRFQYDDVGRLVLVDNPDSSTKRTIYGVGTVTAIDEMGHDESRTLDEYGRVTRVEEKNRPCPTCARQSQFTAYSYDALDRVTSIVDHAGNRTSVTWDTLNRQTRSCDPDRGCQTYTFYDNGQLKTRTDAKGQLTRWVYDSIGRPKQKEEVSSAGAVGRTITWHYDRDPTTNATQGWSLGRVVREEDEGATPGSRALWYDRMGRVTRSRQCVDAVCAELGYGFDLAGRLATIDYPDAAGQVSPTSEQVTYRYDPSGRLSSVGDYVRNLSYDGRGQPTLVTYGNGVQTQNSYDARRGWLDWSHVADLAGNVRFHATYDHYPVGRIRLVQTWNPTYVSTQFDFDELGRLGEVTSTDPARTQSFRYDAIGNMTYNSKLGDYHYEDAAHVHAVTRTDNGDQYAYDANGNMRLGRNLAIDWTHDDMPASILDRTSGASVVMAYDPAGRRVKRTVNGVETTYSFGPLVERNPDGDWVRYYYAGDRLVTQRDAANRVTFYTQDLLHSTRVMTDHGGNAVNRYEYLAYGQKVAANAAVPTDWTTFGGQDNDGLSGFVYLNARYYDPKLGRFLSADSLVPATYRPQSLNRYSYVENDPVNFWDPSGHMPLRVELKKEIEAQSRASFARVAGGLQCSLGGGGLYCSVPFESWGELLASGTRVKLNVQGQRIPPPPLSPPPLLSLEQAEAGDVPVSDPSEWEPFPEPNLKDGRVVAILAGPISAAISAALSGPPISAASVSDVGERVSLGFLDTLKLGWEGLGIGAAFDFSAFACFGACPGALDIAIGAYESPTGGVMFFLSVGGSVYSLTPGPNGPEASLGLGSSMGLAAQLFISEAQNADELGSYSRATTGGYGLVNASYAQSTSGPRTIGLGVGVGKGFGIAHYNTYTITSDLAQRIRDLFRERLPKSPLDYPQQNPGYPC